MRNETKYEFTVETLQYGQARPYADSVYDYIVESEQPESVVKNFCTNVLFPMTQEYKDWQPFSKDPSSYFYGYYIFKKVKENVYRYRIVKPYTD